MDIWNFNNENPYCVKEAYRLASEGKLVDACCVIGRANKGWVIHDAIDTFGLDNFTQLQLNRAIEYAYTSDDTPFYNRNDLWYYLLEGIYARPINYIKRRVPNSIRVYRGGTPNGWSWTTNLEKAKWFQQRWKSINEFERGLWITDVQADNIIFFGTEDYEGEVVLKSNKDNLEIKAYAQA